jgi:hypothetical protein
LTTLETDTVPTEQELLARISQLEKNESERVKASAVASELGKYDLAPGAAEQLHQLISPSVDITKTTDGKPLVFGPEYTPLSAHVAGILQRPEYGHYLRPKENAAPAQAATQGRQPSTPAVPSAASTMREILPGENFGSAALRVASATKAVEGDPRTNLALPLALGRRGLPK